MGHEHGQDTDNGAGDCTRCFLTPKMKDNRACHNERKSRGSQRGQLWKNTGCCWQDEPDRSQEFGNADKRAKGWLNEAKVNVRSWSE
jgi:hypothetical protein